jgi:hypothetical protein
MLLLKNDRDTHQKESGHSTNEQYGIFSIEIKNCKFDFRLNFLEDRDTNFGL